MTDISILSRS